MTILSTPIPQAKPEKCSGSMSPFFNTSGWIIPAPAISSHPVCLHRGQPVPSHAQAAQIHFHSRFYEREVAGAESCFHLCVEKFREEIREGELQVGEGYVGVYIEDFDLVEEYVGACSDGFIAVCAAWGCDADGGLMCFHHARLDIARVGSEQDVGVDIESVLHVPCWVVFGEIECFEVIVVGVDIGTILDGESHTRIDIEHFVQDFGDDMWIARVLASSW